MSNETSDPRQILKTAKSVAVRAAAARDLAETGGGADAVLLADVATSDKSTSVRLYASASAAEIVARGRSPYRELVIDGPEGDAIQAAVTRIDPDSQPGLLLCLAGFPSSKVLSRLARMARDPRHGVRVAATAAFRRMALSGASVGDDIAIRDGVAEAMAHAKLPTDAAVELIRLIGEVGWAELASVVERAHGRGEVLEEAAKDALQRIQARHEPAQWTGIWVDEGRDVLEQRPAERAGWMLVDDPELVDGQLVRDGLRARKIWAPRVAEEGPFEALQLDGRTYWRLKGKLVPEFILAEDAGLAGRPDLVEALEPELIELGGAAAMRAQALLLARTGFGQRALDLLDKPLSGKRPRNDLYFIQGLAFQSLGKPADAKKAFARYLDKAKKNEPWRAEAEVAVR